MKLKRKFVEKPWGQEILPALFNGGNGKKIGEIWFEAPKGITPQLMVKYLFTSEKLSIQVHPNDRHARRVGFPHGKDESWYILDAEPDAVLGLGLKKTVSATKLKTAAILGEIEQLLDWKPAKKGDYFHVPAGTIHAIGPGISLVEVQRNVDITYRMYDYGRPRELHLDEAIGAAKLTPYDMKYASEIAPDETSSLSSNSPIGLFQIIGTDDDIVPKAAGKEWQLLPLEGSVTVRGKVINAGECGICAHYSDIDLANNGKTLIACLTG
ncbi:class I mannose-6-phosphate isomerase [Sphingorhabdus sp. SMR4y]|uniref:class I mannose-6-phosphate isomerase n=1 Tax=Sphingorhabdus sp. SMR4y TaxID=2584094 RepID=UPI000B5C3445|nr:class I mannose-6-phosphate isomerase [Sphingorhabdus sp. SMR4y]ASK87075.1 mannose-6-phosphate isomerase ManA [Sphingorhabdus sp. SMR4y]